jgi:thioredoxin-like negative regulator of GroEL
MKQSVPATVLFKDGKLVNIAMGRLFEPALKKFIETGEIEKPKQPTPQEFAARASLTELEASLWQVSNQINVAQNTFNIFKAEWDRRLQEKLG